MTVLSPCCTYKGWRQVTSPKQAFSLLCFLFFIPSFWSIYYLVLPSLPNDILDLSWFLMVLSYKTSFCLKNNILWNSNSLSVVASFRLWRYSISFNVFLLFWLPLNYQHSVSSVFCFVSWKRYRQMSRCPAFSIKSTCMSLCCH